MLEIRNRISVIEDPHEQNFDEDNENLENKEDEDENEPLVLSEDEDSGESSDGEESDDGEPTIVSNKGKSSSTKNKRNFAECFELPNKTTTNSFTDDNGATSQSTNQIKKPLKKNRNRIIMNDSSSEDDAQVNEHDKHADLEKEHLDKIIHKSIELDKDEMRSGNKSKEGHKRIFLNDSSSEDDSRNETIGNTEITLEKAHVFAKNNFHRDEKEISSVLTEKMNAAENNNFAKNDSTGKMFDDLVDSDEEEKETNVTTKRPRSESSSDEEFESSNNKRNASKKRVILSDDED